MPFAPPFAASFVPGETFERYTIEALIGRGGMGEVYRATDTRLRRRVALKVLRPERSQRPESVARLYREARAAAALTHPNAVAVHDVCEAEGVFYIVMELVTGQPLLAFVGDDRVPSTKKITWLTDVARALAAAHRAGIIHRDVKPSNVMVSDDGFAKVLDFGLARPIDRAAVSPRSFRTQDGRVLGTLRYMAPEQIAGADGDARSDQYAFGVTAYELLAGTHPFDILGGAVFDAPPKPLAEANPSVPSDVSKIIERALAKDPDDRFASMDEVVHAFEQAVATQRRPPAKVAVTARMIGPDAETATADTLSAQAVEELARAPTLAAVARAGAEARAAGEAPAQGDRTLLSKEAPSAIVRQRDVRPNERTLPLPGAPPRTLVSGTSGPPPPTASDAPRAAPRALASASAGAVPPPSEAPKGRAPTVVVSVLVLAAAAFAGTYLGSQRIVATSAPRTAAAASSPAAASAAPIASASPSATPSVSASASATRPKATATGAPPVNSRGDLVY